MGRRICLVVAAGAALTACGQEPSLDASTARALHGDVDDVRTAADAGDREGARRALDALARRVERQQAGGALSDDDAAGMLDRVAAAKRRVEQEIPEAQATPEPTATPAAPSRAAPAEPGTGNDEEQGKGETEGKGQDKDKDDDKGEGTGGDD